MMRRRVVRRAGVGVLGATAIAGGAYMAGSHAAKRSAQEEAQEARLAELEAQQQYPSQQQYAQPPQQQYAPPPQYPPPSPPPAPAAPAAPTQEDRMRQLKDLADLKQAGVLTDQEFEREKARILGS